MKKILLAFVAGLTFSAAVAQSTTVSLQTPSTTVVFGGYNQATIAATFPVVNTGTQPIDLKVRRKVIQEVAGSENNFCWGVNCYPPFVSVSPDPETIAAGATNNSFIADYSPWGHPGITIVRYTFFRATNATDSVHVTLRFDATAATMGTKKDINGNTVSLDAPKPNPANELTTIGFNVPANSRNNKLRIFNAIGGLVKEVALSSGQGSAIVTTSNLANGVYFYTLQVDGRSVETKKLIVRH